jgi:arginine exporter protein ArgO
MLLWPNRSEITFTFIPFERSSVACVCLKSWKRILGTAANLIIDSESNTFLPFLIMGTTYTVLTAIWSLLYVYLINLISAFMKKPKIQNIIEGITGTILIGFGIKLFLEKTHN